MSALLNSVLPVGKFARTSFVLFWTSALQNASIWRIVALALF